MANNTNQHFVHKGYLRPFCNPNNTSAIALFNVTRNLYVPSASLKGECSKRYFYGKDPWYEKHMQGIEGHYNTVVRRVCAPNYILTDEDKLFLLKFWMFQHSRTEARAKEGVELGGALVSLTNSPDEEGGFSEKQAINIELESFLRCRNMLDDLKVRLIKNRTNHAFITSDDPAILCNRWYVTDRRPRAYKAGGGVSSSGTILLLPLTPDLLFIAFDGDVYSIPHKNKWSNADSKEDVNAFNQQQYLNFFNNIYCVDEPNALLTEKELKPTLAARPTKRYALEYMVKENEFPRKGRVAMILSDGTRLIHVTESEAKQVGRALFRYRRVLPVPRNWPSLLRFRRKGYVYTNGSFSGFLRKSHAGTQMQKHPDLRYRKESSVRRG